MIASWLARSFVMSIFDHKSGQSTSACARWIMSRLHAYYRHRKNKRSDTLLTFWPFKNDIEILCRNYPATQLVVCWRVASQDVLTYISARKSLAAASLSLLMGQNSYEIWLEANAYNSPSLSCLFKISFAYYHREALIKKAPTIISLLHVRCGDF